MAESISWHHRDWRSIHLPVIESRVAQAPANDEKHARERQVHRLPALASEFFFESEEVFGWGPTLKTILLGTRDEGSPLYLVRGLESTILKDIYTYAVSEFAKHVTLCIPASCVGRLGHDAIARFNLGRSTPQKYRREEMRNLPLTSRFQPRLQEEHHQHQGYVAFASCGQVEFPEPADRNVNMLPFVFGDKDSLPPELQCYFELIEQCPYKYAGDEVGKVGYLTVHESYVDRESAQRREGLHIEAPGTFEDEACALSPAVEHSWGIGMFWGPDEYEGGIYMASSVADTSEVWDALVDKNIKGIVDKHGSCEHLRHLLGPGTKLQANQLVWMTDCTPHEAIQQQVGGYRQFFRVVTSHISHWFAEHSTPNPRVPVPDDVVIVRYNKFEV